MADLRGYSYDRRDVTGRALANAYAQTLGAIFTEQSQAVRGGDLRGRGGRDRRTTTSSTGSPTTVRCSDEPGSMAMGGQAEAIAQRAARPSTASDMSLGEALKLGGARRWAASAARAAPPRTIAANQLEVAVLDRRRVGRTFRRITGAALTALLDGDAGRAAAGRRGGPKRRPRRAEEAPKPTTSAARPTWRARTESPEA